MYLLQELRIALRNLRKAPLTTTVTVISLGLGIGAVTAVFTLANTLLFSPPKGLSEPNRLAVIYTSDDNGSLYGRTSFPDYEDLLVGETVLQDAVAFKPGALTLEGEAKSQVLLVEAVTGNYFEVLGIRPVLGRGFLAEETAIGSAHNVALISQDLWIRRFGADPEITGRTIELGGRPFTVVGVAPEGSSLRPLLRTDAWVPLTSDAPGLPKLADLKRRDARSFTVAGRLRDGADIEQLAAQLAVIGERLAQDHPTWRDDRENARRLTAVPEKEARVNPGGRGVLAALGTFLFGATGLILLIACSNVASLFLARAHQRRRETAVRVALGAGRGRLAVRSLIESLLPAMASAGLGFGLAALAASSLGSLPTPVAIPLNFEFQLDVRVFGLAVLLGLLTSVLFGLAPALSGSKLDLVPALKSDSTGSGRSRFSLRRLLVVAQIAASLVLLVGAGLFLRSLEGATTMDLGFEHDRVAVMTRTLPEELSERQAGSLYLSELTARLAALPEVADAQASRAVELTVITAEDTPARIAGYEPAAGETPRVHFNAVTPGYLKMMQIKLLRGRTFRQGEGAGEASNAGVAVINETFAKRFWPNQSALGRSFTSGNAASPRTYQVIGIVRDGKVMDIDDPPMPYFWTSLYQDFSPKVALLVKGRGNAEAMVEVLRREVETAEGEVTLVPPTPLSQMIELQFLPLRVASTVLGAGGVFGLLLAVLGIYGIISLAVTQRTREVAIRLAIGARDGQVLRAIVRDGAMLTGIGLVVGLAIVLPLARLLRSLLFDMSPMDPLAVGGGAALLLLAAMAASYVPARRATRIDPIRALREE